MNLELLATLTRAVSEHFAQDTTAPGVLFSYLPHEKGQYYGAIHRYFNSGGTEKQIVVCAKNVDPNTCLINLADRFLTVSNAKESPRRQLERLLNRAV